LYGLSTTRVNVGTADGMRQRWLGFASNAAQPHHVPPRPGLADLAEAEPLEGRDEPMKR
jgi:hypothetical protein